MNQNAEPDSPEDVLALARRLKSAQHIDQLKSSSREEILTRLATLINAAFGRALKAGPKSLQLQQKWFTICGYLAQVMARVVRDLEYEKLRTEVDDLKKQVLGKDVDSSRNTGHSA